MKKILLPLLPFLFTTLVYAQQDVCCVIGGGSGNGDSVQTYARIMSSHDCKAGGTFEGKKICAAVADPENSYCGGGSNYQDRCNKCGFFWSGKECLTVDPKEKAKKELEEEAKKKKEAEKKDPNAPASPDAPARVKPVEPTPQKAPDPDNPNVNNAIPEENSLFNRKSKGIVDDGR